MNKEKIREERIFEIVHCPFEGRAKLHHLCQPNGPVGHTMDFYSYFFQAASILHSGFPWVFDNPGGPTELDFKGSGCDPEVLGVLEPKNLKTRPNLTKKSPFSNSFWLLAHPESQGHTQKP